jgi:hypothetical protein
MFWHCALVSFLTIVSSLPAGTYKVPEDDPIAKIRIPGNWKTEEHDEYVAAVSPDRSTHMLAWAVEGNKVAEATGEAMRYIRRHGSVVVIAKSVKEEKTVVRENELPMVSWDATDHGKPMKIRCYVYSARDGRRMIVVTWGLLEAEEKHRSELSRLLESVTTN